MRAGAGYSSSTCRSASSARCSSSSSSRIIAKSRARLSIGSASSSRAFPSPPGCSIAISSCSPEVPATVTAGLFVLSLGSGCFAAWYMLRRTEPILDLTLLRIPSFCTGVAVGALFRIGGGGVSYMMAIMLQVNMGMSAFASGSITLAGALELADHEGGDTACCCDAGASARFLSATVSSAPRRSAACAFITASTPGVVVFLVLLIGGFFRSLQFTSLTTLSYADIPNQRTSAATASPA